MTEYTLRTVSSIGEIPREQWDAVANPGWTVGPRGAISRSDSALENAYNPFVSHDFLRALEESGSAVARTGWAGSHMVVEDAGGRLVGAVPAYVKSHSMGEYVFDYGWADAWERAGGRYYPKLQASVPFTPVTGPRLLLRPADAAEIRPLLADAMKAVVRQMGLSSLHVTFAGEPDAEALQDKGFLLRLDRQFHFHNTGYGCYEDFLGELASRKRKALRRERREALANGIEIEWRTGSDLTEADFDAFFAFYMDTGGRKWGRPYLTRPFFSLVRETMSERMLLVVARRAGRPIAGALNFIGSDALYGRHWGCVEDHPFLHFEVCYHQAIDFAIDRGLKVVEAGAQGEHKLARGYLPVTTRSLHDIPDPGFRRAVADYLRRERAAVEATVDALADAGPFRRRGEVDED